MDNHETKPRPELNAERAASPPPQPSIAQWLKANAFTLAVVGGIAYLLLRYFDAEGWWSIGKVAIGLGLVIFIHELGHFLVAKWCDVHVTTFSIGFGPALPGCSWQWGETTYKLALFPLGGYVQMVGQVDGDESSDDSEEDPRSYKNKSVWQRMAIISAGVIMNVILAIVCFIAVFSGPGKDRKAAVVAALDPGGPAWGARIRSGSVIHQIDDIHDPYFEDLMIRVMTTTRGERVLFVSSRPGEERIAVELEPRLDKDDDRPMLAIAPPSRTQLESRRMIGGAFAHPFFSKGAAARADRPFEFGDVIIATTDPKDPSRIAELPPDPRKPESDQRDYFEFLKRLRALAGKEITIRVERGPEGAKERIDIKVPPAYHGSLGARMQMGQITAIRQGSPGEREGVQAREPGGRHGDIIQQVEVTEPDGTSTRFQAFNTRPAHLASALFLPPTLGVWTAHKTLHTEQVIELDPVRLPYQLRQWAERLAQASANGPLKERLVTLYVLRHRSGGGRANEWTKLQLKWDDEWTHNKEVPFSPRSPLSIPELGIAYLIKTTVVGVEPGFIAGDNALQPRDVIKKAQLTYYVGANGHTEKGKEIEFDKDKDDRWAHFFMSLLQFPQVKEVALQIERNGKTHDLTITPSPAQDWPLEERGLILASDVRRQKADNFLHAIELGLKDTWNTMVQVFLHIRAIVTGRMSAENLGGPITIARVAYRFAGIDFWEFVFFLGLISVNLAVINFLPIPVLDGGHMVFLIYEKIRGKPASEGVRIGATYAGLLLLACLMVFVLFLDIKRLL